MTLHCPRRHHQGTACENEYSRTIETLNQGDGPCASHCFCLTGFSGQVRSHGAVDNTRWPAHNPGWQANRIRAETAGCAPVGTWAHVAILRHQQGDPFCHTTCPATGTETAAIATEGDQVFSISAITAHPQETMFKTATYQELTGIPANVVRQRPALDGPLRLKCRIEFFEKQVKKGLLRAMALISRCTLPEAGCNIIASLRQGV